MMSTMDKFRNASIRDGQIEVLNELLHQIEAGADLSTIKQWTMDRLAPLQAEVDEIARKAAEEAARIRYVYRHSTKGIFNTKTCIFKGTMAECQAFKAQFSGTTYYSIEDGAPWDDKIHRNNEEQE